MKIKVLNSNSIYELEKKVNDFISNFSPSDVFDIKYGVFMDEESYTQTKYSVMIIFK